MSIGVLIGFWLCWITGYMAVYLACVRGMDRPRYEDWLPGFTVISFAVGAAGMLLGMVVAS